MKNFKEDIIKAISTQQGKNVLGAVTHVSKSGMSSRIRCWIASEDNTRQEFTMLLKGSKNNKGLFVSGYGTDVILLSLYMFYKTFVDSKIALQWANNYQKEVLLTY